MSFLGKHGSDIGRVTRYRIIYSIWIRQAFFVLNRCPQVEQSTISADGIVPLHDLCDASCIVLDIAVLLVS